MAYPGLACALYYDVTPLKGEIDLMVWITWPSARQFLYRRFIEFVA